MGIFGNLHTHTADGSNFYLRDSINRVGQVIDYAIELGHCGVAFTEHDNITSSLLAIKHYKKIKEKNPDFKLVLGNEIYLCNNSVNAENKVGARYPHFILLALDEIGHEQIRELSTRAHKRGYMHVMVRRPTYYEDLEEIVATNPGHLVASTACLGGSLAINLLRYDKEKDPAIWEGCKQWIEYIQWIFGKENFYLEMQPSEQEDQIIVNNYIIQLSEEMNIPYIITTDAHYLKKEDKKAHEIYLNSQDGEREVEDFYSTTYMMSEEEIHSFMDKHIGADAVNKAFQNSKDIFDRAVFYELEKPLHIPYVPLNTDEPNQLLYIKHVKHVPLYETLWNSNYDSDRHLLRELLNFTETDPWSTTEEGYEATQVCLKYLIDSSEKMGVRWSAYLLMISDFIKIMWDNGITVGCGRGSGVGFRLLYMLGITQIDPIRETTKTFPWRFLNPDRASVLDIDVDIPSGARDQALEALQNVYGKDRVSKVLTIGTEGSKSAILTSARGLGIPDDLANYVASLIPSDRGQQRTLKQVYYGDEQNDFKPIKEFVTAMEERPEWWRAAQKYEGLPCSCGSHAGGIILVDEPFTKSTALMRTSSGDIVTQFDLHMCEDVSLIKVDLLSINGLNRMNETLKLLLKDGVIEWQGSWKATYDKYLGIYSIERNNKDMWKLVWDRKIMHLFQLETAVGSQGVALVKPTSVDDLATINSVIRLMSQEKGGEQPINRLARFKADITQWYNEMTEWGLTQEEQDIVRSYIEVSYGICEAQEFLVLLTSDPRIAGWSLGKGDKLRKAVAKKKPQEFDALEKEFFDNMREKGLSENLCTYVWKGLIYQQRGYGFNKSHTLSYSLIALQEMNLAFRYPMIYWNCANLICDSYATDDTSASKGTDYGRIAEAIATIQNEGTLVVSPLVNQAEYGFVPDAKNNRVIFALGALSGVGEEVARQIIANRPFTSMEDFYTRMVDTKIVPKGAMVSLIKAGAFKELANCTPEESMDDYLLRYVFVKKDSLTLANFKKLDSLGILPEELNELSKIRMFKDHVINEASFIKNVIKEGKKVPKCGYHDRVYILNGLTQPFFEKHFTEECVVGIKGNFKLVSEKLFIKQCKEYDKKLKSEMDKLVDKFNEASYLEVWNKHADGTMEDWEMQSLSCYLNKHALHWVNTKKYMITPYGDLPEEPVVTGHYTRKFGQDVKVFDIYNINRIAGTLIDKDANHSTITLLTTDKHVAKIKLTKGEFNWYNRVVKSEEGTDKSWFTRGTKLCVCGYRRGDQFRAYRYANTVFSHTIQRIANVYEDGDIDIEVERGI